MEVRNVRHNSIGTIDCEIKHDVYGWIPFTANPNDPEEHGREIYAAAMRGEHGPIAPVPPPEPTREDLISAERGRIRDSYRKAPPASLEDRITALEILAGLKDPEIDDKEKTTRG